MDDGLHVDLFRRDKRKTLRKVETHLVTEDALGPGAGAVGFGDAVLLDGAKKIEVLFHECSSLAMDLGEKLMKLL